MRMETIELINLILNIFTPSAILFLCFSIGSYFLVKQKIYRSPSQGWLSSKEYPIPADIEDFIVTDGKTVDVMYKPEWNCLGQPIFGNKIVKYWQPLPNAPNQDPIKLIKGE